MKKKRNPQTALKFFWLLRLLKYEGRGAPHQGGGAAVVGRKNYLATSPFSFRY